MADISGQRAELLAAFYNDRQLAHRELFAHRHPNKTPDFAGLLIDSLHAPDRKRMDVAFRGAMKTTTAEEAIIIMAGFREVHNVLVLGANEKLAFKVLHAIRREIEKNKKIKTVFGDLMGKPWGDDLLELSNGCTIQALGKGQGLRGAKDGADRPDFILATDVEDKESVRTDEGRERLQSWLIGEVIPMMGPEGRTRVQANVMNAESLSEVLSRAESGFICQRIPWEYSDVETGERKAAWPDRFPLTFIDEEKRSMFASGRSREYMMEYLCVATGERERPFRNDMRRIEPRVRVFEAVNVMYDPARTVGAQSATTGRAVWSWIGPRLIVWDMWAKKLMPDEIINDMLACNETYHPVKMGFEQDGLNEWALQPIRTQQVRSGTMIPLVPVKAPAGKIDFIKALQIYFTAREVWFCQEFNEAWAQFLSFPSGNIDAPNALAYALHPKLKPGVPVYEDFTVANVIDDMPINHGLPAWLALNVGAGMVTAVLAQVSGDSLRIVADWVREGEPAAVLAGIIREANLEAGRVVRPVAGPLHFDRYNNLGLIAAGRRIPVEFRGGAQEAEGRSQIRALLGRQVRGVPALLVSTAARWTVNAFAGGYCRAVLKGGPLSDVAEDGVYKVLAEGLESFAGLLQTGAAEDDDQRTNATTAGGVRYHSAMPERRAR